MTGLWVVLGSLALGIAWFLIEHAIDERRTLRSIQRPKQRTPEEIVRDMHERKQATIRQLFDITLNHRR